MIKNIVVNLSIDTPRDVATEYAVSLAGAFDAHLTGIGFAYEPVLPGSIFGAFAADVVDTHRAQSKEAAGVAKHKFDEAARRSGVAAESYLFDATMSGGADLFGRIARRFDLSVVAQSEPEQLPTAEMTIEAALFESGRPVLVVPYIQKAGFNTDRIMVCWDGSRHAARAVGDALPFLLRAKAIEVVMVADEPVKSDELPGADIAQHLARHRLNVEVNRIVVKDVDVPNAILSHAADIGADLIVMGGYGHSRLREFILGGATRGILATMTVPTLMSH